MPVGLVTKPMFMFDYHWYSLMIFISVFKQNIRVKYIYFYLFNGTVCLENADLEVLNRFLFYFLFPPKRHQKKKNIGRRT